MAIYYRDPTACAEGGLPSQSEYGQGLKALPNSARHPIVYSGRAFQGMLDGGISLAVAREMVLEDSRPYKGEFPLSMQPRIRKPYPYEI